MNSSRAYFVVNAEGLIRVFDQLMNGESGVIRLDNGIRDLGRWDNGESCHHAVGEFLADLGDQESSHTGTSATTKRVSDLETLEAVAAFSLTTNDIDDLVNQLSTLSVMTLGPVVSGTGLSKNEVIRAEKLAEWSSADGIHGTWFEINEDGTRNVFLARRLERGYKQEVDQKWTQSTRYTSLK